MKSEKKRGAAAPTEKNAAVRSREGEDHTVKKNGGSSAGICPVAKKCGGCQYQGVPYAEQLKRKEQDMKKLLGGLAPVHPICGAEDPCHYRCKVHAAFARTKKGEIICGSYAEGTHRIVPVKHCLIENKKAQQIIRDIRDLLVSFRVRIYDEDRGDGLFRHVLIRSAYATGEILVVLVTASPVFPSKNNFVKALRRKHPEITTIVMNINDRRTSMILGEREIVLYGKGWITDELGGCRFRISSRSFYQVNPPQAARIYEKAIELAGLTGKEKVMDAYCGTGTIGILAAEKAGEVIGVESNVDAVRDAVANAKANGRKNIRFLRGDAWEQLMRMASAGEHLDVLLMDPPRTGSSEVFLKAAVQASPDRIVYVSCGPESLARDLRWLKKHGYRAEGAWPYDLFPFTQHIETVCLLTRNT